MRLSTLLALVALVAMFIWAQRVNQRPDPLNPQMAGKVEVIDGDSLVVNGQQVRLQGIDAPEFQQTCTRAGVEVRCGREAAQALRKIVARGEVTCRGYEHDRFNRLLGTCHVGGDNIAALMVREGHAISYGDFVIEEAQARNEKKGLWAGEFISPREYRAAHPRDPLGQPPAAQAPKQVPTPPPRPH